MAKKPKPPVLPAGPASPSECRLQTGWKEKNLPIYIGIDPGATGAVGVVFPNNTACSWPSPFLSLPHRYRSKRGKNDGQMVDGVKIRVDPVGMAGLWRQFARWRQAGYHILVTIERVQPMPASVRGRTQGATSGGELMKAYGVWLGLLAAYDCEPITADPGRWKPAMGLSDVKSLSVPKCLQLYPKCGLHMVKHCDRAEAILLAHYAKHKPPTPPRVKRTGAKPAKVST